MELDEGLEQALVLFASILAEYGAQPYVTEIKSVPVDNKMLLEVHFYPVAGIVAREITRKYVDDKNCTN